MRGFDQELQKWNGKGLIGAEIGVYEGTHAFEWLEKMKLDIAKLYLVDPYTTYDFVGTSMKDLDNARGKARETLIGFRDKVVYIYQSSLRAAVDMPEETLDFVYIDADHRYEFIKADIYVWTPKVKKGGLVGGHDYDASHPEIVRAVKEYCELYGISFQSGSEDWWFRR